MLINLYVIHTKFVLAYMKLITYLNVLKITADFLKFKSNINYLKLELTSFIENKEASTLKTLNTFNQEKADDILSTFPINDEEKLLAIESKLTTYDPLYNDKLVYNFSL